MSITAKVVQPTDNCDLVVGESYGVEQIVTNGFLTDIYLKGKEKPYDPTIFKFYEDNKEIDIYTDPRFYRFM